MTYVKKTWVTKEIIKSQDLNHIEDGIYDLSLELEEGLVDHRNAYKITDPSSVTASGADYIPFYETRTGIKKKVLLSTIQENVVAQIHNGKLTIEKNGTTVTTFKANQASDVTCNITVPTKTSDLTNDSGFVKSSSLSTVATTGAYNDLSGKPSIGNATLTIQKNGADVGTFTANATSAKTINITVAKSDVGLGNVGNFKAVSTVANQGLTDTEKSNARTNIGAGTSNFSGSYNDLTNKPTIPTVNNATLTIQKNGTDVGTFTANASSAKTINIAVSKSDVGLGNVENFKAVSTVANQGLTDTEKSNARANIGASAFSGSYNDLTNKPTIPTVNNGTLTIQKNGTTVTTFTANQSSNATCNITLAKSDVGLGNVGNFKAVSTVANQGLTDTEKANARSNIGAGSSSFSGSYNDLSNKPTFTDKNATLAWETKSTIATIGGTDIHVTMPANPNNHYKTYMYAGSGSAANAATTNGNTKLVVCDNTTVRSTLTVKGTGTTTVTSDANGVITINSSDSKAGTVTSVGTGAGLTGGSITSSGTIKCNLDSETKSTLASTSMGSTASRQYAVGLDKNGKLSVNIPWENSTYSAMSQAEANAGTATTARSITAKVLKNTAIPTASSAPSYATLAALWTAAEELMGTSKIAMFRCKCTADFGLGTGWFRLICSEQNSVGGGGSVTGSIIKDNGSSFSYFKVTGGSADTSDLAVTRVLIDSSDTHYTTHLYAGSGTAANAATTNGNTKLTVADNTTVRNSITVKGTGASTVTSNASGVITINSSDTRDFKIGKKVSSATDNTLYFIYT